MKKNVLQSYRLVFLSVHNPSENLKSEVGHDQGYLLSKNETINYRSKLAEIRKWKSTSNPCVSQAVVIE